MNVQTPGKMLYSTLSLRLIPFISFFQRLSNESLQRRCGRARDGLGAQDTEWLRWPEETSGVPHSPPQAATGRHWILRPIVLRERGQEARVQGVVEVHQWDLPVERADSNHGAFGCWQEYTYEHIGRLQVSICCLRISKFLNWGYVYVWTKGLSLVFYIHTYL